MKVKVTLIVCGVILGICALLALSILLMMGGADFTEYPRERASDWVCEDPHFEKHFKKYEPTETYLVWEGEKIPVYTELHVKYFYVYLKEDSEGQILKKKKLLWGNGPFPFCGTI